MPGTLQMRLRLKNPLLSKACIVGLGHQWVLQGISRDGPNWKSAPERTITIDSAAEKTYATDDIHDLHVLWNFLHPANSFYVAADSDT